MRAMTATAVSDRTPAPSDARAIPTPNLRTTRLDDYPEIQRLALTHSLDVPQYEDWRDLWYHNPLRTRSGKDFPIGWVLETPSGEIVGCLGTARSAYRFRGEELRSAVARAWFVKTEFRAFAPYLMDEYLNQAGVDLCINNAVSVPALRLFTQFCKPIPLGEWNTMSYWVTGYRGFAERDLARKGVSQARLLSYPIGAALRLRELSVKKRRPSTAVSFEVVAVEQFDARFDDFWCELLRQNHEKLVAERSCAALSWHFAIPMRKRRLWILTAIRNGKLRAYCTLTRQDHGFRLPALPHGDTQGLRGMRLVDYQSIEPEVDFLPGLLEVALQRCSKEGLYILENLGRGVPKMRALDESAPYQEKLENWKFFYSATDPALHIELSQANCWDPSAFDGDASFE